jgi:hypothetical protein
MNPNNQSGGLSGDTQQQPALQAVNVVWQTPSSNASGPNVAFQNQGALMNVSFNGRSTPDEVLSHHNWSQPPIASHGHAGPNIQPWSISQSYQQYEGQRFDVNGSLSTAQPAAPLGYNLQYPYPASQIPSQSTGQQQPFLSLPLWQPTEMVGFHQQLTKTDPLKATEPDHTTTHFGLLTPVTTNAQNSPPDEPVRGTIHNFESQSQQLWDDNFDAALSAHNVSDAPTTDVFFNDFAAPPEQHLWSDFDFASLNGLFGVNDTTTLDESIDRFNAADPRQDTQLTFHHGGNVPHPPPIQPFDPFLTDMNYPDPDSVGMSPESTPAQNALYPVFLGQKSAYNSVPVLSGLVDAFDTPSPGESVLQTPARPSQTDNPKNAFLIQCKEQGMSYKDIKALGGFEEAESTLRGRYRTLTKPKEQRLRRPEWSDRDVSSLHLL